MTEEQLYSEAIEQMGREPLEPYENTGPRNLGGRPKGQRNQPGHKAGRPAPPEGAKQKKAYTMTPTALAIIAAYAEEQGVSASQAVNQLVMKGTEA